MHGRLNELTKLNQTRNITAENLDLEVSYLALN